MPIEVDVDCMVARNVLMDEECTFMSAKIRLYPLSLNVKKWGLQKKVEERFQAQSVENCSNAARSYNFLHSIAGSEQAWLIDVKKDH